mmetsp:Transcript_17506/g.34157  ORF Transcript_17506/g.34157 Transcript_17506/m.34157 type:complete len:302 (+) Transcript_17506:243-1148(+)
MPGLFPRTCRKGACTMLPAFSPLTIIIASVLQCEPARAALFVVRVLAVISATVWPCTAASAMLAICLPLANKSPAVTPGVEALTIDIVCPKFTLVGRLVGPYEMACPIFHSILVLAHVDCATWPLLRALSMLLVVFPLALEASPRSLNVDAMSMGSVVLPPAFVHVTVGLLEAPVAISLVFCKLALILGAIWPHLDTMAIAEFTQPLTYIADAIPKAVLRSVLALTTLRASPYARRCCSMWLDDNHSGIATKTFALTHPFASRTAISHTAGSLLPSRGGALYSTAAAEGSESKRLYGPNVA